MSTRRWSDEFAFWTAIRVLSLLTVKCFGDNALHGQQEGKHWDWRRQPSANAKPERYDTTVPLLLQGEELEPISLLKSKGHPASLRVLIEVEGEQLVLALEKN
ncbi:hypothetical protein AAFF_G00371920, partial [Aldrovandia affinis]